MTDSSGQSWLARAQCQPIVFAEAPRRADLLELTPTWPVRTFHMSVIRNQPFEFVASVLQPFLAFAGLRSEISYSDYDDSLGFQPDVNTDVVLLWLDYERYEIGPDQLLEWLAERIAALRSSTEAPVMITNRVGEGEAAQAINTGLPDVAHQFPGVYVADQAAIGRALGLAYRDRRAKRITGTTISDLACVATARRVGLEWLPALLMPGIKAIAVDLDGTLYDGVLGEDGPSGIVVRPAHVQLQRRLIELRESGIFLAAVTRNDPDDVARLFRERADLPLRGEHFSSMVASWEPKTDGLRRVARELRIGDDAILFVDDNPGELAAVAGEIPAIRGLHAADPGITARALSMFPGLYRFRASETDRLRVLDLKASATRERLRAGGEDSGEFLRSLEVELSFAVDARADQERLHELSGKTNQFNTALRRFSAAEVARYIEDPKRHAVSISLTDRLSNSGIVGAVFTRRDGRRLVVDEVAISCRALGRQLERLMVTEAVRRAAGDAPAAEVVFLFARGPRNGPARAFLEELAGQFDDRTREVVIPWGAVQQAEVTPVRITGRAA